VNRATAAVRVSAGLNRVRSLRMYLAQQRQATPDPMPLPNRCEIMWLIAAGSRPGAAPARGNRFRVSRATRWLPIVTCYLGCSPCRTA
jgi:hypothetical protein